MFKKTWDDVEIKDETFFYDNEFTLDDLKRIANTDGRQEPISQERIERVRQKNIEAWQRKRRERLERERLEQGL